MQQQTQSATTADLMRFAYELERIRQSYLVARDAISEHRRAEDAASERGDRRGVIEALEFVVGWTQTTFDLYAQFCILVAEIDPATSVAQKLAVIGAPVELESSFEPSAGIVDMLGAGVDSTPGAPGGLHQLRLWGSDEGVRLCAQRVRASLGWLRATLGVEERGAVVCECPQVLM